MESEQFQLLSSPDEETIADAAAWLDEAGIPSRSSEAGALYGHSRLSNRSGNDRILYVSEENRERAMVVLEERYTEFDLPEDHYLQASSDEELAEVVGSPSEWSPFDVAHAKRLLKNRDIDVEAVAEIMQTDRREDLIRGIPVPPNLLFFGWAIAICGGVIGILIGLSIAHSEKKFEGEEFYTYDAASRESGKKIMIFGIVMGAIWALGLAAMGD